MVLYLKNLVLTRSPRPYYLNSTCSPFNFPLNRLEVKWGSCKERLEEGNNESINIPPKNAPSLTTFGNPSFYSPLINRYLPIFPPLWSVASCTFGWFDITLLVLCVIGRHLSYTEAGAVNQNRHSQSSSISTKVWISVAYILPTAPLIENKGKRICC